ncbi:MAG: hypothetical protein N2171_03420 [Clostridia bacterium]|nr:hypothetical protein [Clostridia bacterium]
MSEDNFQEKEENESFDKVEENEVYEADYEAYADTEAEGADEQEPAVLYAEQNEEAAGDAVKNNALPRILAAVLVVLIIAAIVITGILFSAGDIFKRGNKYNKMGYINISGRTLAEVAQSSGKTLDEFIAEYSLPTDMPGDTTESAAYYSIPLSKMAEMNGMTVDEIKERLELPDSVTGDTTWGEAEGEATLRAYVGEDSLEEFKEYYGFGDEITADTKWKEVRNVVDQKALEERIASEAEASEKPEGEAGQ